jgi:hypothetical protein
LNLSKAVNTFSEWWSNPDHVIDNALDGGVGEAFYAVFVDLLEEMRVAQAAQDAALTNAVAGRENGRDLPSLPD